MLVTGLSLDVRNMIVQIVSYLASEELTATRRAVISATMGVLATSPRALARPRECVVWPAR